MKSKNVYLLLIGQPETTYQMTCELIKEDKHRIVNGEHVYEYLTAGKSKTYHIAEFNTQKYEEFSLRVAVLSGHVTMDYFFDK